MLAKITTAKYQHRGGTKEYEVKVVSSDEGKYLVIKRWGKAGTFGQIQTERYVSESDAESAFKKIKTTRASNGYNVVEEKTVGTAGKDELLTVLKHYTNPRYDSNEALKWLVDGAIDDVKSEASKVKEPAKNFTAEVNSNWGAW